MTAEVFFYFLPNIKRHGQIHILNVEGKNGKNISILIVEIILLIIYPPKP